MKNPDKIETKNLNWKKKLLELLEIREAVEVTTITITVEVTAETKVKVDSIVEVVARTAVDTKTTAESVKEVRPLPLGAIL